MAPGTFFVSISPLFLDPFGAGAGPGVGCGGTGGVKGGYLEISKTGSNTQMALCRGWRGVCTYDPVQKNDPK